MPGWEAVPILLRVCPPVQVSPTPSPPQSPVHSFLLPALTPVAAQRQPLALPGSLLSTLSLSGPLPVQQSSTIYLSYCPADCPLSHPSTCGFGHWRRIVAGLLWKEMSPPKGRSWPTGGGSVTSPKAWPSLSQDPHDSRSPALGPEGGSQTPGWYPAGQGQECACGPASVPCLCVVSCALGTVHGAAVSLCERRTPRSELEQLPGLPSLLYLYPCALQECAPGYYRDVKGLFLGRCVPCQCHGHSDHCLPGSGVCVVSQTHWEGAATEGRGRLARPGASQAVVPDTLRPRAWGMKSLAG